MKVAARLSPGKIVFRPLVEPEDVQTVCLEVADDLRASAERLEEIQGDAAGAGLERLPRPGGPPPRASPSARPSPGEA